MFEIANRISADRIDFSVFWGWIIVGRGERKSDRLEKGKDDRVG